MAENFFCELSVGAAFGLRLKNGRRVVVKAHPLYRSLDFLQAVHKVQYHLYNHSFPCPKPVIGPSPFRNGLATTEEFVRKGEFVDAHDPAIRRKMAQTLAQVIDLTKSVPDDVQALSQEVMFHKHALWPTPRPAIFDFETTDAGAKWIDDIAREAKRTNPSSIGSIVVGHGDWNCNNLAFKDGELGVAYDWDSLTLDSELVILGNAAGSFTFNRHLEGPRAPKPDEVRLFIEEYEVSRETSFSVRERMAAAMAATYCMAYLARIEHKIDPEGNLFFGVGGFREVLYAYGDEYLHLYSN